MGFFDNLFGTENSSVNYKQKIQPGSEEDQINKMILDMARELYKNYKKFDNENLCENIGIALSNKIQKFDHIVLEKLINKHNNTDTKIYPVLIYNFNKNEKFKVKNMPDIPDIFKNKYSEVLKSINNNKNKYRINYIDEKSYAFLKNYREDILKKEDNEQKGGDNIVSFQGNNPKKTLEDFKKEFENIKNTQINPFKQIEEQTEILNIDKIENDIDTIQEDIKELTVNLKHRNQKQQRQVEGNRNTRQPKEDNRRRNRNQKQQRQVEGNRNTRQPKEDNRKRNRNQKQQRQVEGNRNTRQPKEDNRKQNRNQKQQRQVEGNRNTRQPKKTIENKIEIKNNRDK